MKRTCGMVSILLMLICTVHAIEKAESEAIPSAEVLAVQEKNFFQKTYSQLSPYLPSWKATAFVVCVVLYCYLAYTPRRPHNRSKSQVPPLALDFLRNTTDELPVLIPLGNGQDFIIHSARGTGRQQSFPLQLLSARNNQSARQQLAQMLRPLSQRTSSIIQE